MRNFSKEEIVEIAKKWQETHIVYAHKKTAVSFFVPTDEEERKQPKVKKIEQYCLERISRFVVLECAWEVYRDAVNYFASNYFSLDFCGLRDAWELADLLEDIEPFEHAVEEHDLSEAWNLAKRETFTDHIDSMLRPYNTAYLQMQ